MLRIALIESNLSLAQQLKSKIELNAAFKVVSVFQHAEQLLTSSNCSDIDYVLMSSGSNVKDALSVVGQLKKVGCQVVLMSAFASFQTQLKCLQTTGFFLLNKVADVEEFHNDLIQREQGNCYWPKALISELNFRGWFHRVSENLELIVESVLTSHHSKLVIGDVARTELQMLVKKNTSGTMIT